MKRVSEREKKYGAIIKSTPIGNASLMYTLEIETAKGTTYIVKVGGSSEKFETFRYDPRSTEWEIHEAVNIQSVELKSKFYS